MQGMRGYVAYDQLVVRGDVDRPYGKMFWPRMFHAPGVGGGGGGETGLGVSPCACAETISSLSQKWKSERASATANMQLN